MAQDVDMITTEDVEEDVQETVVPVDWVKHVILMHQLAQIVTTVEIMETMAAKVVSMTRVWVKQTVMVQEIIVAIMTVLDGKMI